MTNIVKSSIRHQIWIWQSVKALISTWTKMQCFSVLLIFWYHSLWKKLVLSFFSYFENWDVFHLFYCDSLGKIFFILVEESITHLQYAIMKEHINSYVSAVLSRCHKNIKTGKFLKLQLFTLSTYDLHCIYCRGYGYCYPIIP